MNEWMIVLDADGNPYSVGTVVAESLPEGFTVRPLTDDDRLRLFGTVDQFTGDGNGD